MNIRTEENPLWVPLFLYRLPTWEDHGAYTVGESGLKKMTL